MGHMSQQSIPGDGLAERGTFGEVGQETGRSERREWDELFHDIEASRQAELPGPPNQAGQDQQVCFIINASRSTTFIIWWAHFLNSNSF